MIIITFLKYKSNCCCRALFNKNNTDNIQQQYACEKNLLHTKEKNTNKIITERNFSLFHYSKLYTTH